MKVVVKEVESKDEGLSGLLGQQVAVWCNTYIYAGTLVGVNETCIKLDDASVVYETGELTAKSFQDAQKIGKRPLYIQISAIEAFMPAEV